MRHPIDKSMFRGRIGSGELEAPPLVEAGKNIHRNKAGAGNLKLPTIMGALYRLTEKLCRGLAPSHDGGQGQSLRYRSLD